MMHLDRMLYSRKEAAYQLSLSVRQVDILIGNKHLKTRHIGGRVLIPHGELKRFAASDHYNIHYPAPQPHQPNVVQIDEHIA